MTDDPFDEAERKLAAIMAADVVGFSRMAGADEAGTLAALQRARRQVIDPVVARHRGRVLKVMGDGLLVEFPSSMLALRAAIAVQAELPEHQARMPAGPRIVLRIGIHQGDVLVHGDDLLGNGVNIAARLEALSPHGGICVSARVREDAFGKVALPFEDGGEQMLKNIARPMRVFFLRSNEPTTHEVARPTGAPDTQPSGQPRGQPDGHREDGTLVMPAMRRQHSLVVLVSASPSVAAGQVVVLSPEPLTVGRQAPSTFVLPAGEVSRTHCRVELADGHAVITDLRSTNGTFVDNRRVVGPMRLGPNATIKVGPYVIRYVVEAAGGDADATHVMRG